MHGWIILLAVVVGALLPVTLPAHEGEEHRAEESTPALPTRVEPRLAAASAELELVAVLRPDGLLIYLDHYASNEPVGGATVTVEWNQHTLTATPVEAGLYRLPAAEWPPGEHELLFTVAAPGLDDVLLGSLRIPEKTIPQNPAVSAFSAEYLRLSGAGLLGLLAGWLLGRRRSSPAALLLALGLLTPAIAHEGESHGAPAPPPAPVGDAPIRLPDGRLFVPKSVQRLLGVRTVVAEMRDTPKAVELNGHVIADPSHSGRVQATQGGLLAAPPEGLPHIGQAVRAGQALFYLAPLTQPTAREPLRAPVDGVISLAGAVAGQVVNAGDILVEIIDPRQWWAEAVAYDASLAPQIAAATGQTLDGQRLALRLVGMGYQRRSQGLPLHFQIDSPAVSLSAGQPLRIFVQTRDRVRGVPAPRDSVIPDSRGEHRVWIHTEAEYFAPRAVQGQSVDGATVVVTDGVQPGERMVITGAAALSQVR